MNYIKLENKRLFHNFYFYIDILQDDVYIADKIFVANNLKVKFIKDFRAKDINIFGHIVKINKKDNDLFIKSMEELNNKIILLGYNDYENDCTKLINEIYNEIKRRKNG